MTLERTASDPGENELGSSGRQRGRKSSLSSGEEKKNSTARQNINLKTSQEIISHSSGNS